MTDDQYEKMAGISGCGDCKNHQLALLSIELDELLVNLRNDILRLSTYIVAAQLKKKAGGRVSLLRVGGSVGPFL